MVLLASWIALFAPQVLARRVFLLGDSAAFRPFAEYSRERWLTNHERTFWNPYVFAGIPASASLADSRPQYLPDALLELWEWAATWLPPLIAPLAAHIVGMVSMAWLVRELWRSPVAVMIGAGIAWGLMPNLLFPLAFGHNAKVVAASLIPTVLLCLHSLCSATDSRRMVAATLALALTIALQLLAGHPQVFVYSSLLAAVFLVERITHWRRPRRLLLAGAAAALGLAISAAVWWPALLYGVHSVRGAAGGGISIKEVSNFSFAVRDLASLIWPWAVGFGGATYWGGMRQTDYPQYLGATVCLLALVGLPRRRGPETALALLLLAAGMVAALHALGTNLGPAQRFLHRLPVFSSFRVPVAGLIIIQLAFVLLAARGLGKLAQAEVPRTALYIAIGATIAAALAALGLSTREDAFIGIIQKARPSISPLDAQKAAERAAMDLGWRALLAGGTLAFALWAHRRTRAVRWVIAALVMLIAVDLAPVSLPVLHRATGTLRQLDAPVPSPLARLGAPHPQSRVASLDRHTFYSNHWIAWRVRSVSGLHGAVMRAWDDLMQRQLLGKPSVLRALAVRYVGGDNLRLADTTDFLPLKERSTAVFQVRRSLPRAYAVGRVVMLATEDHVLMAMGSPRFDPSEIALVTDSTAADMYQGSRRCNVRWLEDAPDKLSLEVTAHARAFLVVADTYFPGWQADVDGQMQSIYRVNHLLRGIIVPRGRHIVTMTYTPEGWARGAAVTRGAGAGWLLLVVALAGWSSIRRHHGSRLPGNAQHG